MRCFWLAPAPAIPKHATPSYSVGVPSSAPQPRQRCRAIAQTKQGPKKDVEISGSDILRALQRASASKSKSKNRNKKRVSSSSSVEPPTEQTQTAADCTSVRPLCIKPHWPAKLDDLDKRLQSNESTTPAQGFY
ncbi:uncharacterized protein LOC107646116 [Arachis ipaensis]|uniref:uncharacterized protein LOC107646116 n=1 Tax=Arachis ipaensis TaxID=130454 RepID=UPI0007AF10BC|nr:uncharacterized protein LOC107646116 [Arachis ipaensis]XP_025663032.1 uncharacterized protein LOC112758542 [Arachis hypogaea]